MGDQMRRKNVTKVWRKSLHDFPYSEDYVTIDDQNGAKNVIAARKWIEKKG